jgi:transposase-like protein
VQAHVNVIHLGIDKRPNICNICNKKYRTRCELNIHIESSHMSREKKFKCEKCDSKFVLKTQLIAHQKFIHIIDGKVQKCVKCHFVTETKSELLSHINRVRPS